MAYFEEQSLLKGVVTLNGLTVKVLFSKLGCWADLRDFFQRKFLTLKYLDYLLIYFFIFLGCHTTITTTTTTLEIEEREKTKRTIN